MTQNMKNTKFLITGASGQLANSFISHLRGEGLRCLAPDEDQMDITDQARVQSAFEEHRPDVLINCAAFNQVDLAEEQPDLAYRVNSEAVRHLACACKQNDALLVHFSSDYVFDGRKGVPYTEDDRPDPVNVYGKSKLKGEEAVSDVLDRYLIFRLSWVFGAGRQNFLYKLTQWASGRDTLEIVDDEYSVPTYTEDAVRAVLSALDKGLTGTYHLTNTGQCSRYEWAKYYAERSGISARIVPVPSGRFPSKAERPLFTCMSNGRLSQTLNTRIPDWRDAVGRFVERERKMKNAAI